MAPAMLRALLLFAILVVLCLPATFADDAGKAKRKSKGKGKFVGKGKGKGKGKRTASDSELSLSDLSSLLRPFGYLSEEYMEIVMALSPEGVLYACFPDDDNYNKTVEANRPAFEEASARFRKYAFVYVEETMVRRDDGANPCVEDRMTIVFHKGRLDNNELPEFRKVVKYDANGVTPPVTASFVIDFLQSVLNGKYKAWDEIEDEPYEERCDAVTLEDCSDAAMKYLKKQSSKSKESLHLEILRLVRLGASEVSDKKSMWIEQRVKLLRALMDKDAADPSAHRDEL